MNMTELHCMRSTRTLFVSTVLIFPYNGWFLRYMRVDVEKKEREDEKETTSTSVYTEHYRIKRQLVSVAKWANTLSEPQYLLGLSG